MMQYSDSRRCAQSLRSARVLRRAYEIADAGRMVAARAREIYDRDAKERQKQAGEKYHKGQPKVVVNLPQPIDGKSRDLAGKAAHVSGSYVDRATKITSGKITGSDSGWPTSIRWEGRRDEPL